jgi:hypothetical protein
MIKMLPNVRTKSLSGRWVLPLVLVISTVLAVSLLSFPSGGGSISVSFKGYGGYSEIPFFTNREWAFFTISNTSPNSVFLRGVADSSSRQFAQVFTSTGWIDVDPWISTGATFYLNPGDTEEIGVLVETNSAWRVAFRFRPTAFVDHCPWLVWKYLPESIKRRPVFNEMWSEPIPAFAASLDSPPKRYRHLRSKSF